MFLEVVKYLSDEIKQGLPGWEAQKLMIYPAREKPNAKEIAKKKPRQSSVLIWLYPKNEDVYTRLILRTDYEGVHSAQVAFPGGAKEKSDIDLWHTALREAKEEVGLPPEQIKYVGKLTPVYIPPSNFWVQPFIGMSEENIPAIIDTSEVQHTIEAPIRLLLNADIKGEKLIMRSDGVEFSTPYYNIEEHTVWGATAMMLSELEVLLKRIYK